MKTQLAEPLWLMLPTWFLGAEGEGDDDSNDDADDGEADDDGDDSDDSDDSKGDDKDDKGEKPSTTESLLKALREERTARKAAEKLVKASERAKSRNTEGDKAALKQAEEDLADSKKRTEGLAAAFKKSAVDRAIEKAARTAKFRDTDDALAMVDRNLLDIDQDEDDPASVDIDADSVKRAVKKLADTKKHLIMSGTDDDEPTGSQFGGKGKKNKQTTEEVYQKRYSSL